MLNWHPVWNTIPPATYTRVINLVLRGLNWKVVLAFLDDILVLGKDFKGHLANLRAVLAPKTSPPPFYS
jgi:hypothetical protein